MNAKTTTKTKTGTKPPRKPENKRLRKNRNMRFSDQEWADANDAAAKDGRPLSEITRLLHREWMAGRIKV